MHNAHVEKPVKIALTSLFLLVSCAYTAHGASKVVQSKNDRLRGTVSRQVSAADKLMLSGKYAEAEELYHQAINGNSKDLSAIVGYGTALSKQYKLDRALEEFDRALKLDPKDALAHCGKATVLLNRLSSSSVTVQKNRSATLASAECECKAALDIDPDSAEAHTVLGQIYREEGQLDQANQSFNEAIKLDSKSSEAYAGLGQVSLQQGNQVDAEKNFKTALSINTGNSTAHYGLGQLYLGQGAVDRAIAELNTSLYQYRNSGPVHLELGKAYEAQGNAVAAIREYQESIRIKPENAPAYLAIANIRESRGDIEHAIAELRSGAELMQNSSELQLRIASDCLRLEKLDDAIKSYEAVLNTAPRSTAAVQGLTRAYYLKSQKEASSAFISSNEYEQADEMIAKAIRLNPNNLQLRLAQAKMRALSGQSVDLSQFSNPRTDAERIGYAEALLAQNKFSEATEQMDRVIANANGAKELLAVGDLALMIKDLDNAERAYKKAGTIAGNDKRAQRGLALVAKSRESAKQDLTLADDLARRKQLASSIDKYHASIFGDPRRAEARDGLAQALERLYPDSSKDLRDAITQYRAYMALSPNLPEKEKEKLDKHIAKLDTKANKLDEKNKVAKR